MNNRNERAREREEAGGKILITTTLLRDELPSGVCQINGAPSFVTDQL